MSQHIERFKIPLKPGWKGTRKGLLRFCRDSDISPPRFALDSDEIPQELENLQAIAQVLSDSEVSAAQKVRFKQILAFLEAKIREVQRINSLSEKELLKEQAEKRRFHSRGGDTFEVD